MPPVNKRKQGKRKQTSSGFLFWAAFALLVILLFFINKDKIANALRSFNGSESFARGEAAEAAPSPQQAPGASVASEGMTSITEIIAPDEDGLAVSAVAPPPAREDDPPYFPPPNSAVDTAIDTAGASGAASASGSAGTAGASGAASASGSAGTAIDAMYSDLIGQAEYEGNDITEITVPQLGEAEIAAIFQAQGQPLQYGTEPAPAGAAAAPHEASAATMRSSTRQQRLYFVSIDREGRVVREEVLKDIPRSDSPLADALVALFAGPSDSELRRGLISLIPAGTRLLSASIREDGVAHINVSEEFRFNQFGADGAINQLAQVVFTATTFPTVNAVQILIEGQRLEYLGAEGVWIGTPLSRKEFFN